MQSKLSFLAESETGRIVAVQQPVQSKEKTPHVKFFFEAFLQGMPAQFDCKLPIRFLAWIAKNVDFNGEIRATAAQWQKNAGIAKSTSLRHFSIAIKIGLICPNNRAGVGRLYYLNPNWMHKGGSFSKKRNKSDFKSKVSQLEIPF